MRHLTWTLLGSLAACAAVYAASYSGLDETPSAAVAISGAPAPAAARANPYAGSPDALRAGAKLYRKHCASCHGASAEGTRRAPSLLSDAVAQAPPGELEWFLRNGRIRHGMPEWSGLPEQRRWQLVAFLESKQ